MLRIIIFIFFIVFIPCSSFAATVVQRHGITWTLADNEDCGTFVNGDPWCVGPVSIVNISPASVDDGTGRIINGSMLNPDPTAGTVHGFDSWPTTIGYVAALNVATGVTTETPLTISTGSLISTISLTTPTQFTCIQTAAVLTILSNQPPANAFRPPYNGTNKTVEHNEAGINYNHLANLTPTSLAPTFATMEGKTGRVWLDLGNGENRQISPTLNMHDYGRENSTAIGDAALLLNANYTNAEKKNLLINLLQIGIDIWGSIEAGSPGWQMDGGKGPGRKFPVLFAGRILGDADMLAVGSLPYNAPFFGEDQTTLYMTEYEATRWIGQDGKYSENNLDRDNPDAYYTEADWTFINSNGQTGIPEYSKTNGTIYQGRWISKLISASYRQSSHVNCFTGWLLAAHAMGLKSLWNHDALFDYTDRYLVWSAEAGDPAWFRHYSTFAGEMWATYRGNYPPIWQHRHSRGTALFGIQGGSN